jgi:hypothetical protein
MVGEKMRDWKGGRISYDDIVKGNTILPLEVPPSKSLANWFRAAVEEWKREDTRRAPPLGKKEKMFKDARNAALVAALDKHIPSESPIRAKDFVEWYGEDAVISITMGIASYTVWMSPLMCLRFGHEVASRSDLSSEEQIEDFFRPYALNFQVFTYSSQQHVDNDVLFDRAFNSGGSYTIYKAIYKEA